MRKRIAVIGGGIAGLAAAVRLRDLDPTDTEIIVYEQSGALGGKLRTGALAGRVVERGAEAFLMDDADGAESAAVRFARRVGLGEALVHPTVGEAAIALGGRLEPLPSGTLFGVPADVTTLGTIARAVPGADTDDGRPLLRAGDDISVGALVRHRLGDEVVDRLVDPLLGGVYAGRADRLSLAATMPALARAARQQHTLTEAVRAARAATVRVPGRPIFATVAGGLSRLVTAAVRASGARISLGLPVREVAHTGRGWRLVLGTVPAPVMDDVDAVVLAVPAAAAARLLGGIDRAAATEVGILNYASVALVALALPADTALPRLSGFLIPAGAGTLIKAVTFVSTKWAHLGPAGGAVVVRASIGRCGEEQRLHQADEALIATAHAELSALLGDDLPPPLDSWLQRWGGALPQYAPGHLDRVSAARVALGGRPGLALAGAAYDGVGIPACVLSGERAAEDVVKDIH